MTWRKCRNPAASAAEIRTALDLLEARAPIQGADASEVTRPPRSIIHGWRQSC
jgi:hypothetical protein